MFHMNNFAYVRTGLANPPLPKITRIVATMCRAQECLLAHQNFPRYDEKAMLLFQGCNDLSSQCSQ